MIIVGRVKRRYHLPWILLGVTAILMAANLLLRHESEPVYDYEPLSYWLGQLAGKWNPATPATRDTLHERQAIRAIGTNALPLLITAIADDYSRPLEEWLDQREWLHTSFSETAALRHERARASAAGIHVLGDIARPLIPELTKLAKAGNAHAVVALGAFGCETVPMLLSIATNDSREVKYVAIGALPSCAASNEAVVSFLVTTASDASSELRGAAIGALVRLKVDLSKAMPVFAGGLSERSSRVKEVCAWALAHYKQAASNAIPSLYTALHTDQATRPIVRAIVAIEGRSKLSWLLDNLAESDPWLRSQYLRELGSMGQTAASATNALAKLAIDDPDENVRKLARQTLHDVANPIAAPEVPTEFAERFPP